MSAVSRQPAAAVFLDRDGTLMEEVDYCRDPALVRLIPGVREGLAALKAAGFQCVIVTNQSGIGRGRITESEYHAVHGRLMELIGPDLIDATYYCPDMPGVPSECRKPAPGMIFQAARDHSLDLTRSWMIGDKESDIGCGRNAGTRTVLVTTGYGAVQGETGADFTVKAFPDAVSVILR